MMLDPAGYYAQLDLEPAATPAAIAAAYRRKARVLHPDVPGTGNADAFLAMKQAYDVLSDAHRRAAYDRDARAAQEPEPSFDVVTEPVVRGPRPSDLPLAVWVGLGGLMCLASVMAVLQFHRAPAHQPIVPTLAAPLAPPPVAVQPAPAPAAPAMPATDLATTHYVVPAATAALLWERDGAGDKFLPLGKLADFTPVQAVRMIPQHGLVEIHLDDGRTGFVDAARLIPGDSVAAHRAFCADGAGAVPANGEILERHGNGPAHLTIQNRGSQPIVVKLRDSAGQTAVTMFVTAASNATIPDLPDAPYRAEFAVGELWSRACRSFAAGMRAQRLTNFATPAAMSPLLIPPAALPEDIGDDVFERD